jgi:hypothetical protein
VIFGFIEMFGYIPIKVENMMVFETIDYIASPFLITDKAHGPQNSQLVGYGGFGHVNGGG